MPFGWCWSIGGSTAGSGRRSVRSRVKFGCSLETLRKWVQWAERDQGLSGGLTSGQLSELGELRRENRELRRANEILSKASAYFVQAELATERDDEHLH